MFSRLFHLKKESTKVDKDLEGKILSSEFQSIPRLPYLEKEKVRVLVFKDCERKSGKLLLFDSDTFQKCDNNSKQNSVRGDASRCPLSSNHSQSSSKYQNLKPNADVKMLGEMVFGSVAMVYKGAVVKIHIIRSPPQLMMSKVFALRSRSAGVNFCDNEQPPSCPLQMSESVSINVSSELNLNSGSPRSSSPMSESNMFSIHSTLSKSTLSVASGYLPSSYSSYGGGSLSSSPNACLQKRFNRFQRTSLASPLLWRTKSEHSDEVRAACRQQPKIGISVIFKLWDNNEDNRVFQNFIFSHYSLVESHLQVLRVKIEKSFYLRQHFLDTAVTAVECFKDDLLRLFYTPRIIEPTWLKLMTSTGVKHDECIAKLMKSFMRVVQICENKESNYFLSILLTAILSHHTSWVATVMSSDSSSKRVYQDKHSSKALTVLAKCHPYNPLWAQLCDMYGSVNTPLKISRTVIVGRNKEFVCQLLQLLTYFIRCSDVKENDLQMESESNTYRFSGSSWGDSPNSVQSWVEQTKQMAPAGSKVMKKQLFNEIEDQQDITCNKCYCELLRRFDLSKLRKIDRAHLSRSVDKKDVDKCCDNCRTYAAFLLEIFCENCSESCRRSLSLDSACNVCAGKLKTLCNDIGQCHSKYVFPTKSTFVCYCCSEQLECNAEADTAAIEECPYRPRKFSDPIPCISPKLKSHATRNSTKSDDSGAEMSDNAYSFRKDSSSSHASSHGNIVLDLDSDYCSIDNDLPSSESDLEVHRKVTKSTSSTTLKDIHLTTNCPSLVKKGQVAKSALALDLQAMNFKEINLPRSVSQRPRRSSIRHTSNFAGLENTTFGRSLFAGYSKEYTPNVVLQGVLAINKEKIVTDLKNTVLYSVLDEEISDAVCIVANTDNWTCELWNLSKRTDSFSSQTSESLNMTSVFASGLVSSMIETTKDLWEMNMASNFCLLHLEDQLKDIYNRGKVLTEFASSNHENAFNQFIQQNGYHSNDVGLLLHSGSTHAPPMVHHI